MHALDRKVLGLVAAGLVFASALAVRFVQRASSSGEPVRLAPSAQRAAGEGSVVLATPHASEPVSSELPPLESESPRAELEREVAPNVDAKPPKVLLRGRLDGCAGILPDADLVASDSVGSILEDDSRSIRGQPRSDGTFELDVSALFFDGTKPRIPRGLELRAAHEDYFAARIDVPLESRGMPLVLRTFEDQRTVVLRAHVKLCDEAWISGEARTTGGLREGIQVRLVEMLSSGPSPAPTRFGGGSTDSAGRFRIKIGAEASLALVGCLPGSAPATVRLDVPHAGEFWTSQLLLTPGESVSGHLRLADGRPLVGAKVRANRRSSFDGWLDDGSSEATSSLDWTGEVFAWASGEAITDANGAFAITGLSPGEHVLGVRASSESDEPFLAGIVVEAPAEEIELGSMLSCVHLVFVEDERLASQQRFMLREDGEMNGVRRVLSADEQGRISFWLAAKQAYAIDPYAIGGGQESFQFRAPPAGEEQTIVVRL